MQVYTAQHLLPIASPAVRDGAVAVDDGRIVHAGPRDEVLKSVPEQTPVHELGPAVILPGLVNAHTHLELSWMGAESLPRGDYVEWLRAMLDLRERADPKKAREAAEEALKSIVERGTVAVGDVGNEGWAAPVVARSPLHGILFYELYGLRAGQAETMLKDAAERLQQISEDSDVSAAADRLCLALTPHAPHTTSVALLRALAGRAAASGEPLSIHVAESPAEIALLADGTGPLADLYRERGFTDEGWQPPGRTPIEHLKRLGVLSSHTLAVHCVHLDKPDHSSLQAARATVVACPRSNEFLGVGTAPVPALMREGIPVALGTDSLASSPDLDLFAEMASLRRDYPELSPAAVLRMATFNGARALGLGERLGSIKPGKLAELIVVPLPDESDDPLEWVCSEPERVYRLDEASRELAGAAS